MLSCRSVCSALGINPKVILSRTGATVVAGDSRDSDSSTTAGSSTVSSVEPPHATSNIDRQSRIKNVFFTLPPLNLLP